MMDVISFTKIMKEFREVGKEFTQSSYARFKKTKRIVNKAKLFCEENLKAFIPEFNEKSIRKKLKKKTLLNLTVNLISISFVKHFLEEFWSQSKPKDLIFLH